jgi:hypothetical protein
LSTDDFARWTLDHRLYDVDVDTGVVTSLRTGRPLRPQPKGQMGYPGVNLCAAGVVRNVTVHRLIALKTWGVAACRGWKSPIWTAIISGASSRTWPS